MHPINIWDCDGPVSIFHDSLLLESLNINQQFSPNINLLES